MQFKYEFKLYDRKLNDVEPSFASKDYQTEEQANISAKVALKDKSNARYAEIFQYRYVKGFMKDKACIGRFTKADNGEMSYIGL
jgi:hypothetical protein